MDGHKRQGMSDEVLEREIEAALGVEPSPEFLPRIRTRIANERVQEGWFSSASWRWAIVLAGATAVVVLGLWIVREPAPAREVARAVPPPVVEPPPSVPEVIVSVPETARPVVTPLMRQVRTPQPQAIALSAVVISPDDAVALRQLVVAIAARQVEATDIPQLGAESAPLPLIEEIVLEPIELSPIAGLE